MVQTCDAVCCYQCSTFQVQLRGATKKRWSCSLCGSKQSYTRVFASGSAKDLRPIVQNLNMARGAASEEAAVQSTDFCAPASDDNQAYDMQFGSHENAWQWGGGVQQAAQPSMADPYDPYDPWGGHAPWGHASAAAWAPPPPQAFGAGASAQHHQLQHQQMADESSDVYVTEMPARGKRVPPASAKRKYGDGAHQFMNDPRRMAEQRFRAPEAVTWQQAQHGQSQQHTLNLSLPGDMPHGGGAPPRAPPRAFHAPRPPVAARDDDMYVTAGASEVIEEEVWQG